MRRTARTVFMTAVLVLTLGVAAPAQAGKADPVQIKGTLVGTETWYPAGQWEDPATTTPTEFVVDGETYTCAQPANVLVLGRYVGVSSPLGKVMREEVACIEFDSAIGIVATVNEEWTLIAANGDRLNSVHKGFWVTEMGDDWADFVHTFDLADGTGRFVSASGVLIESGRVTTPPYPTEGDDPYTRGVLSTISGEISYDASNRATK